MTTPLSTLANGLRVATDQVETPAQIRSVVEEALRVYPAERVFLNPDCGFGTFSNRPMNTSAIASAKVAAMADWPGVAVITH